MFMDGGIVVEQGTPDEVPVNPLSCKSDLSRLAEFTGRIEGRHALRFRRHPVRA